MDNEENGKKGGWEKKGRGGGRREGGKGGRKSQLTLLASPPGPLGS